ncbi:murein biosynthesis integral membrane protein MurJ [Phytomonospora endophytica]|uniref:Putative peptidoglycan lipid II flippase n=1 Tax=Phytomonospora endophytica TaxID=714109 RepID=A0A841FR04_9ACTN|nr:murein biosynthesis integral membrane protein MurJ [Phytomonospora endophytica]MBB6038486.1 putative peptidoglycan lipid II flippase [Phytomonospora endophytica]GIG64416.1 lipid II flippase MurJ [Phytomonospora endophytica]
MAEATSTETGGSVVRNSAVMAVGTIVSRLTGFGRNAVIGAAIGGLAVGNAYSTAQFFPQMIYELLLGGILTSVLVPLLVRARKTDADHGEAYTQRFITLIVVLLAVATALVVACAPLLAKALTKENTGLVTELSYLMLPMIFFYGVAAVLAAVLNTRGHFAAPMWAPILNNFVIIATGVLFLVFFGATAPTPDNMTAPMVLLLGGGTLAGIVVQVLGLLPALRGVGFTMKWRFDFRQLQLGHIGRLSAWMFCYVAVSQVSVVAVLRILNEASARDKDAAGPFIYNNAYLLMMMAHGIVAVSIITALMPRMSAAAAEGRNAEVSMYLSQGIRLSGVILLPATGAYVVFGGTLASLLFDYGNFTASQAAATGLVTAMAGLTLMPFAVSQLQTFVFYALPDTKTPALLNIPAVAMRVGIYLLTFAILPAAAVAQGLMVGNGVSYVVAALLAAVLLRRRLGPLGMRRISVSLVKLGVAAAAGALAGWAVVWLLPNGLSGSDKLNAIIDLVIGGIVLGAVYLGVAYALRAKEVTDVVSLVKGKLGR